MRRLLHARRGNAPASALARALAGLLCLAPSAAGEDREELLRGVAAVAAPGTPGVVCAFGAGAFVVVADADGAPVVAAAEAGKGRVLVLGHSDYARAATLETADTRDLVRNAVRWLTRHRRGATVACPGQEEFAAALEALGFRVAPSFDPRESHCVVLVPGSLSRRDLQQYQDFVQGGGSLYVAATGWGWQSLNPKLDLARDFAGNRLLVPLGLAFTPATARATEGIFPCTPVAPLAHAARALEALRGGGLEGDGARLAQRTLKDALGALPDHEPTLMVPLRELLEAPDLSGGIAPELAEYARGRKFRPLGVRWSEWSFRGPTTSPVSRADLDGTALDGSGPRGRDWRVVDVPGDGRDLDVGEIRLDPLLAGDVPGRGRVLGMLSRSVQLAQPRELTVFSWSTGPVRFFLNGSLVGPPESSGPGEQELLLSLEAGTNHLLVELTRPQSAWIYRLKERGDVSQERINQAIDRGVAYLLDRQFVDGSWDAHPAWDVGYTSFALYALLKSGVAPEQPALQRGIAYIAARESAFTYSLSSKILALAASGSDVDAEIAASARTLLSWQEDSGLFSYPVYPDGTGRPVDLSTSLFAALALRAAEQHGVDVPDDAWRGFLEGTLRCLEPGAGGRDPGSPAGFSYRIGEHPTGSMTLAGITLLEVGRAALGSRLEPRRAREIRGAIEGAMQWLDARFTLRGNPGNSRFHYYFLYGLERVGALLGVGELGGTDWYRLGAEYLVEAQNPDGSWQGEDSDRDAAVDTILALLFLGRATAVTGEPPAQRARAFESERGVLRATGENPLVIWVQDAAALRDARGDPVEVRKVVYLFRDARGEHVLAEVGGEAASGPDSQRFAARISFDRPGKYEVFARFTVQGSEELLSGVMAVEVGESAGGAAYALHALHTALQSPAVVREASSALPGSEADAAVDGRCATAWLCEREDANPWWRARFSAAVGPGSLFLSHASCRKMDTETARVRVVEVVVNGSETHRVTLEGDPHGKTEVLLDTAVNTVEVRILEVEHGTLGQGSFGFSEIQLVTGPE